MYDKATSEIILNGFRTRQIPIQRSVREGCPLSMTLYSICLKPLIQTIDKNISGIRIGKTQTRTAIVAYADDVTVFLTRVEDIPKLEGTLHRFEAATGAKVNVTKSRTLALGNWNKSNTIINIPNYNDVTILGYQFTNINTAAAKTWSSVVARMQATAQDAYQRHLTLDKRIQFVQHLLAKNLVRDTDLSSSNGRQTSQ